VPNLNRDVVISKLKKGGFRTIYSKDKKGLSHFINPRGRKPGIKFLGYLNFLGVQSYDK